MLTPNFFIKIHGLPKSVVIKSNQNNKVRIIRKFLSSKIYSKPRVSGPRYTQLGHKEACNLDCPSHLKLGSFVLFLPHTGFYKFQISFSNECANLLMYPLLKIKISLCAFASHNVLWVLFQSRKLASSFLHIIVMSLKKVS